MAATTTTQSPTPGGSLHWPIGHGGPHHHHHHHQQISASAHHHHRFTIAAQPRGLSPPSSPMLSSMPSPGSRTKAPLRTINRGPSFLRSSGRSANAKRKSAVELLAESKAFYVKSEKVLDSKQELRNSGHLQVAPTSAAHTLSGLLSSAARPASAPKASPQQSSAVPAPVSLHCCGPRAGMGCRIKGGCGQQAVVPPPSSFSPPSPPRGTAQPGATTAMLTMVMISSSEGRGFGSARTPSPPSSPPPVLPPKSPRLSSSAPSGEGRGSAVYYPTAPFPPTHCTRRTRAGDSISGTANRRSQPGSGSHSEDVTMQLRRLLMPTVSREEEEAAEAERRSAQAAAAQAAAEEAAAQAAAEAAAERSQQQQRRRRHMRRPSGAATPPPRYYRRLVDCEDDGDEEDNVGEDDSDEEDDDTHTGSHSRRSSGNDRFDTRTVAGQDASYSLRRRPRAPALNSVVHKSLPDLSTPRKSPRNSDGGGRESKRSDGYARPVTPLDLDHIPDEVFRQSSGEWVDDESGGGGGWGMGPMPTIPPPRRYSGGGGGSGGGSGGGGGSSGGRCHCCNGRGEGSGGGSRVRQRSTPSEKGVQVVRPAPPLDSDDDSLDNSDDDMGMAVQRRRLSARVSPPPRHRPILRSKSDISHRYSRPANSGLNSPYPPAPSSSSAPGPELPVTPIRRRPLPPPPIQQQQMSQQQACYSPPPPPMTPRSSADLERFFDRLGLGNENSSPSAPSSPCPSSPPVFFDSVSSVDSWPGNGGVGMPRESGESGGGGGGRWREAMPPGSEPSIVERNARIIKWLCNCRKAQLGGGGGGVGTSR